MEKFNEYNQKAVEHFRKSHERSLRANIIAKETLVLQNRVPVESINTMEYFTVFGEFGVVDLQKMDPENNHGNDALCIRSFNGTFEKSKYFVTPMDQPAIPWSVISENKALMEYYTLLTTNK